MRTRNCIYPSGMDPPVLQTINDLALASRDQAEVSSIVINALEKIVKELSEVDQKDNSTRAEKEAEESKTEPNSSPNSSPKPSPKSSPKSSPIFSPKPLEASESSELSLADRSTEVLIAALERERLHILSDIQKHEYIGNQLRDILEPNQKLVADVKHYLARRHQIHANDVESNNNRLVHYETSVVRPTIEKLDSCSDDLHKGIAMYKDTVQTSLDVTASTSDTLTSLQFKQQLDALIDVLNNLAGA